MTKAKKIIIGTLAAGLVATATCIAASAYTESVNLEVPGNNSYFEWGAGYASVLNTRDQIRWAMASVEAIDNRTGKSMGSDSDTGPIDYNESISASVETSANWHYKCVGRIYAAGSPNSTVDSRFDKRYPE
ncbi:MAG: hypothetical protein K2N38_09285 [Oscillospiraceae bacterium]|nr:hypothetical protein [Oscillospiraceae bacterium]